MSEDFATPLVYSIPLPHIRSSISKWSSAARLLAGRVGSGTTALPASQQLRNQIGLGGKINYHIYAILTENGPSRLCGVWDSSTELRLGNRRRRSREVVRMPGEEWEVRSGAKCDGKVRIVVALRKRMAWRREESLMGCCRCMMNTAA